MNTLQETSDNPEVDCLVERLHYRIEDLISTREPKPRFSKYNCIYRVPEKIRSTKENAYTPQLVSIGPLHNSAEHLRGQDETKARYVKSFFERISSEKRYQILAFIGNNEQEIRDCYEETFMPERAFDFKVAFVTMIMKDAVFIIELFVRSVSDRDKASESLLAITALRRTLSMDLELLENQLPYFVLEEIYKLANLVGDQIPTSIMELSCSFFGYFSDLSLAKLPTMVGVKHFCDWRRITLLESYRRSEQESMGWIIDLPSAVKLQESGVSFKCVKREHSLNIEFKPVKRWIAFFDKYELQIPHLDISDSTERHIRNMMALEQCSYPLDTPFCNYIIIMDCLIDTEKDVDLLVWEGVITNHLGDNASVAKLFNKLGENIIASSSSDFQCCEDLKAHFNNRCYRFIFPNPKIIRSEQYKRGKQEKI